MTTVMDFVRKGMQAAQPRFHGDKWMERGDEIAIHEVGEANIYRHDIEGFNNPLARWIAAASPSAVLDLLDRIAELEAAEAGR